MLKKRFVLFVLIIISIRLYALPIETSTFSSNDLILTNDSENSSYQRIKLFNLPTNRNNIGSPSLPYIEYNYIIPTGSTISSFDIIVNNSLTLNNVIPYPEQRYDMTEDGTYSIGSFSEPNLEIYEGSNAFPLAIAEIVDYNFIAGDVKIASIRINPVSWNPQNNQLTFNTDLTISYNLETTSSTELVVKKELYFQNDLQIYKDYIKYSTDNYNEELFEDITIIDVPINEEYFNYLIVVPDEYDDTELLRPFIEWKEQKGNFVKVMNYSSIPEGGDHIVYDLNNDLNIIEDAHQDDLTDYKKGPSLRQYLFGQFKNKGLTYVLIIGNDQNSPYMLGHKYKNTYGENARNNQAISDLYLSDFNGDWNVDGLENDFPHPYTTHQIFRHGESDLSILGEPESTGDYDNIDTFAEVFIGRIMIPLDTEPVEISNWIEKTLTYEKNPSYGNNLGYLKNAYWHAGGDGTGSHNSPSGFEENMNTLSNEYGFNCTQAFRTLGSVALTNMQHQALINGDWHGSFTNVATWRQIDNVRQYSVTYENGYFSEYVLQEDGDNGLDKFMSNNGEYGIMMESGCATAWYNISYDWGSNYWPEARDIAKLQRVFMSKHQNTGGAAWIGSSNTNSQSIMNMFRDRFYNSIFSIDFNDYTRSLGVGFAIGKNNIPSQAFGTQLGLTLFGDPNMNVWKNIPKVIELEAITANSIRFTAEDGSSLSDALVRLKTADGWIETVPDENNIVTSDADFSEIALFKDGYLPTTAKVIENSLSFIGVKNTIWQNLIVKGSLDLAPNSIVKLTPGISISLIEGAMINTTGTGSNRAILTCNVEGQTWNGIKVIGSNTKSKYLENLVIKNTETAIDIQFPRLELKSIEITNSADGINAINSAVTLENVIISTENHGVVFTGSTGSIFQSSINNCTYGITTISSNIKLRESYITNNSYYGIFVDGRDSYIDLGKDITKNGNKIYNNGISLNPGEKGQILVGDLGQVNLYKGKNDIHSSFTGPYPEIPNIHLLQYGEEPLERDIIVAWYNYWGKPTGTSVSTPTSNYFYPSNTSSWLDFSNYAIEEYFLSPSQPSPAEMESFEILIQADQEIERENYNLAENYFKNILTDYPNTEAAYGAICKLFELYKVSELDMELYLGYINNFIPSESITEKTVNELKLRVYLFLNDKQESENQIAILSAGDETELERILTAIDETIAESLVENTENLSYAAAVIDRKAIKKKVKKILDLYKIGSGKEENQLIANSFELLQNYPNPFNPVTTIKFVLPKQSNVKLQIFNVKGELVRTLVDNQLISSGMHKVNFDGTRMASGVYYYSIKAGEFKSIRKMMLVK